MSTQTVQKLALGQFFEIKELVITAKKPARISKYIEVVVKDNKNQDVTEYIREKEKGPKYTWKLEPSIIVITGQSITIRPFHSRPSRFSKRKPVIESLFSFGDLESKYFNGENRINKQDENYDVEFSVAIRGISDISEDQFDPDIPSVANLPLSPDDIQSGLQNIQSVLSPLESSSNFIDAVMTTASNFATLHPIAQVAFMALSIPYKVLKNEKDFNDDLKALGDKMCHLLVNLKDIEYAVVNSTFTDVFTDILNTIVWASKFIDKYINKNSIRRLTAAQSRSSLDQFRSKLSELERRYTDALLTQIARVQITEQEKSFLEKNLKPSNQGDPGKACLKNTRVEICEEIDKWISDPTAHNILHIRGSPGVGKSTIASTVVKKYHCPRFFKEEKDGPNNPKHVWPTVAFDLAKLNPTIKNNLIKSLRNHEYFADNDIIGQFQILIHETLHQYFQVKKPIVVVLDALDKYSTYDVEIWRDFLQTLKCWSALPKLCKLIVTSRDHPEIIRMLEAISKPLPILVGEAARKDGKTVKDLKIFFEESLRRIREVSNVSGNWLDEAMIEKLAEKADGLFLWASTVVKYIGDGVDIKKRLDLIFDNVLESKTQVFDLYYQIFEDNFRKLIDSESADLIDVLAAIVLAKDPLSKDDLQRFQIGGRSLHFILRKLSPVLSDSTKEIMTFCHQTVADFLFEKKSSLSFFIDKNFHSAQMAKDCLKHLNSSLKFNNFDIKSSYTLISGTTEANDHSALTSTLKHSALYFTQYLENSFLNTSINTVLYDNLEIFLRNNFLSWLEIFCYIKRVQISLPLIQSINNWLSKNKYEDLAKFAADAEQFITAFRKPISESIPHIYLSAIPFSPKSSQIYANYHNQYSNTLRLVAGNFQSLPMLSLVEKGHTDLFNSVTLSPDEKAKKVSGSDNKAIQVTNSPATLNVLSEKTAENRLADTHYPSNTNNDELWNNSTITEDGWFRDPNGNSLFWVPEDNRKEILQPYIDLSCFVHGEDWTKCYTPK